MKRNSRSVFVLTLLSLLWLSGCASHKARRDVFAASASPQQEIERLENDLQQADANGVKKIAPEPMAQVEASLKSARKELGKGQNANDVLDELADGRLALDRARKISAAAEAHLADLLAAREAAVDAGANPAGGDFKSVDGEMQRLASSVASMSSPKPEAIKPAETALIKRYATLEIAGKRQGYLGTAYQFLREAEKEGARKELPRTAAETRHLVAEADALIQAAPRSPASKRHADEATFMAKRLLSLTRDAKALRGKTVEDLVLWTETQAQRASKALALQDLRDRPLAEQWREIQTALAQRTPVSAPTAPRGKSDPRLAELRRQLSAQDADVYREGDRLIVRLKRLSFPAGKAVLLSRHFPLLDKVDEALQRTLHLGETGARAGTIVIAESETEGAGDNSLSRRREQSIRDYLLRNGGLSDEQVKIAGGPNASGTDETHLKPGVSLVIQSKALAE